MDRGIPTEAVLEELRQADAQGSYRVGTPQGRLTKLAAKFADQPWQQVRPPRRGQLLPQAGEVHVPAHRGARTAKERARRQRQLKAYWQRQGEIQQQDLPRDERLQKLGAARDRAARGAAGLVPAAVSAEGKRTFTLDRPKRRPVRQREGRYFLRTNLVRGQPRDRKSVV